MKINEVEALSKSIDYLNSKSAKLHPPIWIELVESNWEIGSANEPVIRINSESGEVLSDSKFLSPIDALVIAKSYAEANNLKWKPGYVLSLESEFWNVGACQSQLGGQVHIHVSHKGNVVKHFVNPK